MQDDDYKIASLFLATGVLSHCPINMRIEKVPLQNHHYDDMFVFVCENSFTVAMRVNDSSCRLLDF